MAHTVERLSPCRVSITASIDAERTAAEREQVTAAIARTAVIDGFRRGKAPRALVERRFAAEIQEKLEDALLRVAWQEVRESAVLRPAGPLEVKHAHVEAGGGFHMSGEVEVFPEVEVSPLAGFTPPPFDIEPTPEEIEGQLQALRERQAAWAPVPDEPVSQGLLVEAEIFGEFPDGGGEPFHSERTLFRVGEGEVHPEIEAAVVGHGVGEEVAAEKVLEEEAGAERAGKRIAYRIVIKSLRRKQVPDLDDAFVASLGIEGGVAQLSSRVRERLLRDKVRQRREVWQAALVEHLLGGRTVELPPQLVKEETREEVLRFARTLAESGVDLDKAAIEWPRVEADMQRRVEERMRRELVLDAAAAALGLTVADAEVDAEVERQARTLGVPFAELRGNLAKKGGLEGIRSILRREKVLRAALPEAEAATDLPEGG